MISEVMVMTYDEKNRYICSFEYDPELAEERFPIIKEFAADSESWIRSWAAMQLVDYKSEEAKNILLYLTRDKDYLVRTEAYDSLSAFPSDDVVQVLKHAITHEKSGLARGYAIISWAVVIYEMDTATNEDIQFLRKRRKSERSYHCILDCYYALYILGDKSALKGMLFFLNSKNYQNRCGAINLLRLIVDEDNKDQITDAIVQLLSKEEWVSVRSSAEIFLEELKDQHENSEIK